MSKRRTEGGVYVIITINVDGQMEAKVNKLFFITMTDRTRADGIASTKIKIEH